MCMYTMRVYAALSAWQLLLTTRHAFGGSAELWGLRRPFGFAEEQRSRRVAQTVLVASVFVQGPRLSLLVNSGLCGHNSAGV